MSMEYCDKHGEEFDSDLTECPGCESEEDANNTPTPEQE